MSEGVLELLKRYQSSSQYESDYSNRYHTPALYTWICTECESYTVRIPKFFINPTNGSVTPNVRCTACGCTFIPKHPGRYDIGAFDTPELSYLMCIIGTDWSANTGLMWTDINVAKFMYVTLVTFSCFCLTEDQVHLESDPC